MSAEAAKQYQLRADLIGVEVPPILNGEPVNLLTAGDTSSLSEAASIATHALESLEPFVIAGVPEVYEALGNPLAMSEWQRMQRLGRDPRAWSAARYVARQLVPLAARVMLDTRGEAGTPALWLEAVARDELIMTARKRALYEGTGHAEKQYEPSQAYLVWYTGGVLPRVGHLTVVQGEHRLKAGGKREYLAPRYFGARLLEREMRSIGIAA